MQPARRPLRRAFSRLFIVLLLLTAAMSAAAAERPRLRVQSYDIDAELLPQTNRLKALAKVQFTAIEDISLAVFELHNGLRPSKVTDAEGKSLAFERVLQDSTVRVSLPAGLARGQSTTLTFDYEGLLQTGDESPVYGLKLAYVGQPISYLLYAGRWFPMVGYGVNRFTANINITVPTGYHVIGSGSGQMQAATVAAEAPAPAKGRKPATPAAPARQVVPGKMTHTFAWDKPSFPGTIIAGQFEQYKTTAGGVEVQVYFRPANKELAAAYADTAAKQYEYFSSLYGPGPSRILRVAEIPDDTVPSAWAPEIVALSSRAISDKMNYRLIANTLAHQWWGAQVSPASPNDWWIMDGMARYAEARYVQHVAGDAGFEEVTRDMAVGALAHENLPLSGVDRLDTFSPEFQSLVTDKGGMIAHMLRWVMGDAAFDRFLFEFVTQNTGKPVTTEAFRQAAERHHGDKLLAFFSQWLDSTGAPEFKNKYTVFRTPKGFRVVGEISQDLDLFRMPVELRIDTDGKSETKRIEVVGMNSPYVVETFGKPRRIVIDPANYVLKNSPELRLRVAILRGQQLVQQGDLAEALKEFNRALEVNKNSSLAHYRIAEVFFLQRNYQAAANAYRESLNGDREPAWTEVWSHIQLGKIFDLTGQRERATNEYRQAIQTNDNTQNAQDEARKYLQTPYERAREEASR